VLANFFNALLSSKAHWYRIIAPTSDKPQHHLIQATFPSLSNLFSLDDNFTSHLLVLLHLAWYKKGNYSPLLTAWENFITEFKLPAEITTFSISSKQCFYIRLGSWKEKTHPQVTPLVIWKKACHDGSYSLPKLRISSLSMRFASDNADLGFNLLQNLEGVSKSEECRSECESESSSESESENENASKSEDESKNESDGESSKNGSSGVKEENQVFEAASDLSPDQYPCCTNLVFIQISWISCCRSL
jgi:hypothetical protein